MGRSKKRWKIYRAVAGRLGKDLGTRRRNKWMGVGIKVERKSG